MIKFCVFRLVEQLLRNQEFVLNPDYKTAFKDRFDAFKRLSCYHVFQNTTYEPTIDDCQQCKFQTLHNSTFIFLKKHFI